MGKTFQTARELGKAAGTTVSETTGRLASTVLGLGREAFEGIKLSAHFQRLPEPGSAPGIEHHLKQSHDLPPPRITCIDYGPEVHETTGFEDVESLLESTRPEGSTVRWINIEGLNPAAVEKVSRKFGIHTLAAEDVVHTIQRPKLEVFGDHLMVVVRQIQLLDSRLKDEQVSLFCFEGTLVCFQEEPGDVFDPVRRRLQVAGSRFRRNKVDYLLYALLDSLVDHLFPLLEGYDEALEELEDAIMHRPGPETQQRLFAIKRELSLHRRTLWPLREVVDGLYRDESGLVSDEVRPFLRDVHDHGLRAIELLETLRDTSSGLHDLYQSFVANRMNETMKVLTIMASFFIPVTFIAGVYGMNFEYIPELGWRYSYFVFWGLCLAMTAALAFYFKRKGWIGGG